MKAPRPWTKAKLNAGLIAVAVASLFFGFNNCGSQTSVEFASVPAEEVALDADLGSPQQPVNPVVPPQTVEEVMDVCKQKTHQVTQVQVTFEDPQRTCDWEQDGNLVALNGYLQGRIEQVQAFTLPEKSVICDLTFEFPEQQFIYDDHFVISFNDSVMASSYDFTGILPVNGQNLKQYDWQKIAGNVWDNGREGTFCAGQQDGMSECKWPSTDTLGVIDLNYSPMLIQTIMASDTQRVEHEFKFVTIGDNDGSDCQHSAVSFNVNVSYVQ